jgi:peptidoglycan/xylan/chitin deacetylase (PgdA/CDA1 family)
LDQLADWARQPREARPTHRSLTSAEAQRLRSGGLFQLGAHTVSHPALSAHHRQVQEQEIRASKEHIESQLGQPVRHFAYPYGDYSAETVEVVREIGFSTAFTTDHGCVISSAPHWQLPRCMVCDWDGEEFAKRLAAMF